jgi:hypothetical protein
MLQLPNKLYDKHNTFNIIVALHFLIKHMYT